MIGLKSLQMAIGTLLWASLTLTALANPTSHIWTSTNASTALGIDKASSTNAHAVVSFPTSSTTSIRVTDTRDAVDASLASQGQATSTNSYGSVVSNLATTYSSTPYFLSTLLAQTSLPQTALEQSAAVRKTTIRIGNTVVKIASTMPSSNTSSQSETLLSAQKGSPSASAEPGQAQADAANDCTRVLEREATTADASCFGFEPLPSADSTTTSTTLPTSSQQAPPSTLSKASLQGSNPIPEAGSSTSSSMPGEGSVSSTPSSEQVQFTTVATASRNTTNAVTEGIMTTISSSQPPDTAASAASTMDPEVVPATAQPEPTARRNETSIAHASAPVSDTTDSLAEKSTLSSIEAQHSSSPGSYGVTNATVFPVVLHTVTYTTTICPSSD
jgi:hypothetical protein